MYVCVHTHLYTLYDPNASIIHAINIAIFSCSTNVTKTAARKAGSTTLCFFWHPHTHRPSRRSTWTVGAGDLAPLNTCHCSCGIDDGEPLAT